MISGDTEPRPTGGKTASKQLLLAAKECLHTVWWWWSFFGCCWGCFQLKRHEMGLGEKGQPEFKVTCIHVTNRNHAGC